MELAAVSLEDREQTRESGRSQTECRGLGYAGFDSAHTESNRVVCQVGAWVAMYEENC